MVIRKIDHRKDPVVAVGVLQQSWDIRFERRFGREFVAPCHDDAESPDHVLAREDAELGHLLRFLELLHFLQTRENKTGDSNKRHFVIIKITPSAQIMFFA